MLVRSYNVQGVAYDSLTHIQFILHVQSVLEIAPLKSYLIHREATATRCLTFLNPFQPNFSFLYPLKTSENQRNQTLWGKWVKKWVKIDFISGIFL